MPPLRTAEDLFERRQRLGQFFTPPEVADFMWGVVSRLLSATRVNRRTAIDPAAGEGVFLRAALKRRWPADRLAGMDIDESLTPVWAQLTREHPGIRLKVGDALLDHPDLGVAPASFDVVIGNPPFGGEGVRRLQLLATTTGALTDPRQESLFAELGPSEDVPAPTPFLSTEELSTLRRVADALLQHYDSWRLARISSGDDNGDVADDPSPIAPLPGVTVAPRGAAARPTPASYEGADLTVDWDGRLTAKQAELLRRLASIPIEVVFAERFVRLCKPGGVVAIILPDGVFASSKTAPFRQWVVEHCEVRAVVGLPQKLFTGVGANAKTAILFARKYTARQRRMISSLKETAPDECECVLHPESVRRRVLLASQHFAKREVSLRDYFAEVIRAFERLRIY
jgi:hypothetical protein